MRCPICKSQEFHTLKLRSEGFAEDIRECAVCASTWSINHGLTEVVRDNQKNSFLEALTECVEGDDYSRAV